MVSLDTKIVKTGSAKVKESTRELQQEEKQSKEKGKSKKRSSLMANLLELPMHCG